MQVKFNGPDDQVNYQVGMETGSPWLEPGKVYEVSDKLGKSLVESSVMWDKAQEAPKSSRKTEVDN